MEPTSSGFGVAAILKFGALKLFGLFASLLGAALMTIFRPPKSRRQVFLQGIVALGVSLLFGGSAVQALDYYFSWIDLRTAPIEEVFQFTGAVYGLIGAVSWGVFGALSQIRDKLASDPIGLANDLRGK
jgi:hypothetical protein